MGRTRLIDIDGMRICDLPVWCEIEAMCQCLHTGQLNLRTIARGRRADTWLRDVERRLRCTGCNAVGKSTLLVRTMPR